MRLFLERFQKDIDDGYPLYLTFDVSKIYPELTGEHNVIGIGYASNEEGKIKQLCFLDPSPNVQDSRP